MLLMNIIPNVIYNKEGNKEQILDIFSRMLQMGIIYINGTITQDTSILFHAQLTHITQDLNLSESTILINSPGGCAYSGLAMVDMIKICGIKVNTKCIGLAASAASIILTSGTGIRSSIKRSRIMIHQPNGGTGRQDATNVAIIASELVYLRKIIAQIYAESTTNKKFDYKYFDKAIDRDHYMSPEKAMEIGLIDKIID